MKYVDKEVINNIVIYVKYVYLNIKLLVVVCIFGYLDIVKELVKVGVDVNLRGGFDLLFVVVCKEGYLNVVEWLCKVGVEWCNILSKGINIICVCIFWEIFNYK